jgi:hypothetical protein
VTRVKTAGNTFFSKHVTLRPDGWTGEIVASATGKNFRVVESFTSSAVPEVQRGKKDLLGPVSKPYSDRVNTAVRVQPPKVSNGPVQRTPATNAVNAAQAPNTARAAATLPQRSGAAALNPQPLPPKANVWGTPQQSAVTGAPPAASSALRARALPDSAGQQAPSSSLVR